MGLPLRFPHFGIRGLLGGALVLSALAVFARPATAADGAAARQTIAAAILAPEAAQRRELIASLADADDPATVKELLDAWRRDELFIYTAPDGVRIPVRVRGAPDRNTPRPAEIIENGGELRDASGQVLPLVPAELDRVRHNAALRRAFKAVTDVLELAAPDPKQRIQAVKTLGQAQDRGRLPVLRQRLEHETDPAVRRALREAIALVDLRAAEPAERIAALRELRQLHTLSSHGFVKAALEQAEKAGDTETAIAARRTLSAIENHRMAVNFFGTLFRGLSLGSILLVAAIGLAITFGLMGVINMAHGEMIAVGAYATYVVQNVFGAGMVLPCFGLGLRLPGLHLEGAAGQTYFLAAIPLSFFSAAVVGLVLERGVIRFLYRRPLESLLATWGVSLLLQQTFRLTFGANNVQVSSPSYLSGNWTINDVLLGWNRVFVIAFATAIVLGTWLVLTRTSLGLLIRAAMQNRTMAACLGVRTERVNMLTFAFGSGLAGLAGAFLSQIGNVGPSLGQSYIVDSFMVVVVGGVGNLAGTVISALSIGGLDQMLQQYLPAFAPGLGWIPLLGGFLQNLAQDSSVFGKILVLAGIILFLQWRPAGLFVARNRSLEG